MLLVPHICVLTLQAMFFVAVSARRTPDHKSGPKIKGCWGRKYLAFLPYVCQTVFGTH